MIGVCTETTVVVGVTVIEKFDPNNATVPSIRVHIIMF